ncbi:MAG: DUF1592 domain-containing protein [Acidobacteriota bacterium]
MRLRATKSRAAALPLLAAALLLLAGWRPAGKTSAEETRTTETGAEEAAVADEVALSQKFLLRNCRACHNARIQRGELDLTSLFEEAPEQHPVLAEKVIRKLRTGLMPPPERPKPDPGDVDRVASVLERRLDDRSARSPQPGSRPFQRLNRAEYERSVRDLLSLEVDAAAFLPPDTVSHGFDNIADVQSLSPTLMQGYLRAADSVSRAALGDPTAEATEVTFKVPRTRSQMERAENAPVGTRGGVAELHTFPATGTYVFKIVLHSTPTGQLFGSTVQGEKLEISVDGERRAVLEIDPFMSESDPNGMNLQSEPVLIKAGPRWVSAAVLERFEGPVDDLIKPIEHTLADTQIGLAHGVTTLPHLRSLTISGPSETTGASTSPSRQKIFSCRPTSASDEIRCAESIVERLAREAYRRPLETEDLASLMGFYEGAAGERGFEAGIRSVLQAILASPHFVFRFEPVPEDTTPGSTYEVAPASLATRLAFFLWGTAPDDELLSSSAALRHSDGIEQQVERMLQDPKAEAMASRFAAQWLRLQDLERLHPDALTYPQYDERLAAALRRETLLFFDHLVQTNASAAELLEADYTFLNERLASHYGIGGVSGDTFRRVEYPDDRRRGLLGHGSILALTSHANRTSPVLRGKWVMEVLLGSPPPPPPPDVPELEATDDVVGGKALTVRERLEEHRANPACRSCHRVIDPIGLALENFDVTGSWRTRDNGEPVDANGELFDGTPLRGPSDLAAALGRKQEVLMTTLTENLLAYALGRRLEPEDMPTVRSIVRRAAEDDYRMRSFIMGVATSAPFRFSQLQPGASSAAGGR